MLDLMIHDIGLVLKLVSAPVARIDAAGSSVLTPHMDIANARLVFADGCVADLNVSRLSKKRARDPTPPGAVVVMPGWAPTPASSPERAPNPAGGRLLTRGT